MNEVPCWIRGDILPQDVEDNPVDRATQNCEYRKAVPSRGIFGGNEYMCTHPAATGEHQSTESLPGGDVMVGGVDGYATFCEPIDMRRISRGETSRFINEGQFILLDNKGVLPPGE